MRFAPALATVALLAWSACTSPKKVVPVDGPNPKPMSAEKVSPKSEPAPDLEASPFPLTLWAAFLADRDYVDPTRFSNHAQMDAALAALESQAPELFARREGETIKAWAKDWAREYAMPQKAGMRPLSELLVKILDDCVQVLGLEGKKRNELEYAAFNGLLEPLDPHTNLLTPEQNASLGVRTRGHFGGIGAEIWSEDRRIRIVRVLPGTPAERAGMMDNDLVYQIDGRSTVNMGASEAQRLLRGPVDSKVKVIVKRKKQLKTLTIIRGKITIPAVRALKLPDNTGYVELLSFQEDCATQTLDAMKAQLKDGAKSLILDLRRNSGGLLTQALALVDGFVEQGPLISVLSRSGREVENAKPGVEIPKDVPLVVLISQNSASASEIVSGALQGLGRAVVVGRRSFGKGSVQQLQPSKPYGEDLALKLTIAEYRVAEDTKIQGHGVVPDLALYPMSLGDHRGVGVFFDIDRFEQARETVVYNRKSKAKIAASPFQLLYLARTPWEKVPTNLKDQAQRAWLDPELRIAAALGQDLAKAPKGTAAKSVITTFVADQRTKQDEALTKALRRWKIDWSAAPSPASIAKEKLELSAQIVEIESMTDSGKRKKRRVRGKVTSDALKVGDVFTLRLRLNNRSDKDVHQVHVRTEYFLPELDDLELVFGKVAAKSKASIDLRLQIPHGRAPHVGTYGFSLFSGSKAKTPLLQKDIELSFAAANEPELEFNYWVVDSALAAKSAPERPKRESIKGEAPFVVSGDGDGRLAPGERVLIGFEILNKGKVTATLPSLVVRNRSREQALLEEGAAHLKKLAPGGRVYGAVAMTVSKDADTTKPVDLQLMVGDRQYSGVVQRELHLPVRGKAQRKAWQPLAKARWVRSVRPLALREIPDQAAPVLGELSPKDRVHWVGREGPWVGLDVGKGRVLWTQARDEELASSPRGRGLKRSDLRALVVAPKVDLELPTRSEAGTLTLQGQASDDGDLEEVVLWSIPEDPDAHPTKLLYRDLAKGATGEARRRIAIGTQVALVPGPQRIRVIARDSDEVETKRDYWVYRGDESLATSNKAP